MWQRSQPWVAAVNQMIYFKVRYLQPQIYFMAVNVKEMNLVLCNDNEGGEGHSSDKDIIDYGHQKSVTAIKQIVIIIIICKVDCRKTKCANEVLIFLEQISSIQ